ncbi:MAG TPA: MFS transporter, partial [Streptomyces sp.]|nr:MFS transporter [Streptomyces sp.]
PGVVSLRKTSREEDGRDGEAGEDDEEGAPERRPRLRTVGAPVRSALFANSALRGLSGFLTFFLAFLLRDQPMRGLSGAISLAVVAVAAGGGNALGTAIGARLKDRGPEVIIAGVLGFALAATIAASVLYGTFTLVAVAATAGISQALGKLSLDALIQRDMPEEVRTSAFARSETLMQMSWVVGGGLGISLPLIGPLGMGVGAIVVATGAALSVRNLLRAARRGSPHPRVV